MSINLLIGEGLHLNLFGKGYKDEPSDFTQAQEKFSSWSDYFAIRLGDKDHLKQDTEGNAETYRSLHVASTAEGRRTHITVGLYCQNGVEGIEVMHFGSGVTFAWCECYLGWLPPVDDGISLMNRLLEVPLTKGWTEIDYYILGIKYKIQAICTFGNTESRQTTIHLWGVLFWLLSLFDLLSSRQERQVPPLIQKH